MPDSMAEAVPSGPGVGGPRAGDLVGLVRTGPGRHRHADRGERAAAVRAELEMRARGKGYAGAGAQGHRLLPVALAPPHLAVAVQDVPDLVDEVVRHGPGDPARSQLEMRHRALAELEQDPHVRAVRRKGVGRARQLPGIKTLVHRGRISTGQIGWRLARIGPWSIYHASAWKRASIT